MNIMNDSSCHNNDKGNSVSILQTIPSSAQSVVTLETNYSRSTVCHDDTFSTTTTSTQGGSPLNEDGSKKRWNKYYQKLKKYQHNWKKGYQRHPKLIPFVKREQRRYDFYQKCGHLKRIELLEALPGFKWETLPQTSTTTIKSNIPSQTLVTNGSCSTTNTSFLDQGDNTVSFQRTANPENHNSTCSIDILTEQSNKIDIVDGHASSLPGVTNCTECGTITEKCNVTDCNIDQQTDEKYDNNNLQYHEHITRKSYHDNDNKVNEHFHHQTNNEEGHTGNNYVKGVQWCNANTPINTEHQAQSENLCDDDTTNCSFMDVIHFCQRSEETNDTNIDSFDCLSTRLKNKAKQLETFYSRNRSKKKRNMSWFQSILVPGKDTSPTAFLLFRWCNIIRGDIGTFFSMERKNQVKHLCTKTTQTKIESKAIVQLLVAIYDNLNPSEPMNNADIRMQSWESKVLDIIGPYNLQRPKRMPKFEQQIKELKNFYLKQLQHKTSDQESFYSLLLNCEPSLQTTNLFHWCKKTRYALNSCSMARIMRTNTNYKINAFVQLYDELQNKLKAQTSVKFVHELSIQDKLCSLIGGPCLTAEEEILNIPDTLNTADLPIKPQCVISQRMMKEYDDMLTKIEEFYNHNSHAKLKSKSWYDTFLNADTSPEVMLLKNWCSSQRSFISKYFKKRAASESSSKHTIPSSIEKIISLYDRLESRFGPKESISPNTRCQTKVYEIIGKPPHLQQKHQSIDKSCFKKKFKPLIIYYIKFLRCKTKDETWFEGVLCRFKSDEVSQLRKWCSKQRNLLQLCNKGDCSYVHYKEAVGEIYDELDVYLKTHQRHDQKMTCDEKVYSLIGRKSKKIRSK